MTERRSRRRQATGGLKAILLTGSVIATLAGTRLLAREEAAITDSGAASAAVAVVMPSEDAAALLPPQRPGMVLQLQPIPRAVQPRLNPVARTRSSR